MDAHPGGSCEAKGLGDGLEVQHVHVEDVLELVGVVGQDVAPVRVLGALVQVVVLLHQLLKLALHVGYLAAGEVVLVQGHPSLLQ